MLHFAQPFSDYYAIYIADSKAVQSLPGDFYPPADMHEIEKLLNGPRFLHYHPQVAVIYTYTNLTIPVTVEIAKDGVFKSSAWKEPSKVHTFTLEYPSKKIGIFGGLDGIGESFSTGSNKLTVRVEHYWDETCPDESEIVQILVSPTSVPNIDLTKRKISKVEELSDYIEKTHKRKSGAAPSHSSLRQTLEYMPPGLERGSNNEEISKWWQSARGLVQKMDPALKKEIDGFVQIRLPSISYYLAAAPELEKESDYEPIDVKAENDWTEIRHQLQTLQIES